ncbi:MAG TPA: hypothetical protein PLE55_10530, partial [Clostridiales bacterium]|nr:hypothetical protein [Clostridiales bacterium]
YHLATYTYYNRGDRSVLPNFVEDFLGLERGRFAELRLPAAGAVIGIAVEAVADLIDKSYQIPQRNAAPHAPALSPAQCRSNALASANTLMGRQPMRL